MYLVNTTYTTSDERKLIKKIREMGGFDFKWDSIIDFLALADEETVRNVLSFLYDHRGEIVNKNSESGENLLIYILLTRGLRIRRILRNPPRPVLDFLRNKVREEVGESLPYSPSLDVRLLWFLSFYVPIRVRSLYEDGYFVSLDSHSFDHVLKDTSFVVDGIYKTYSRFMEYKDGEIRLSPSGYVVLSIDDVERVIYDTLKHGRYDNIRENIIRSVRDYIVRKMKYKFDVTYNGDSSVRNPFSFSVTIDEPEKIESIRQLRDVNLDNIQVNFSLLPSNITGKVDILTKIVIDASTPKSDVINLPNISLGEIIIPYSDISKIDSIIESKIRESYEHLIQVKDTYVFFMKKGEKMGYESVLYWGTSDLSYSTDKYTTHIKINGSPDLLGRTMEFIVSIDDNGSNILTESMIPTIVRKLGLPVKSSTFTSNVGTRIINLSIYIKNKKEVKQLLKKLKEITENLDNIKSETKIGDLENYKVNISTMDERELLAQYLVSVLTPEHSRIGIMEIADKLGDKIRTDVSDIPVDELLTLYYDKVILSLILKGDITLGREVEVKGKPIGEILRETGYGKNETEKINSIVKKQLVNTVSRALANPELGKKYWSIWFKLDETTRKEILDSMTYAEAQKILENDAITWILGDSINTIVDKVVKSSASPSIKTEVIFKYAPQAIGLKKRGIELKEIDGVKVIDVGTYYIQVHGVSGNNIEFLVYKKDIGIGVLYKGRRVGEVVRLATRTYDKIYNTGTTKPINSKLSIALRRDGSIVECDETNKERGELVHI